MRTIHANYARFRRTAGLEQGPIGGDRACC
jgi:hypothetical protein